MSSHTVSPVVVGTDGSSEADAALMRGAWEADRRAVPLRVVHGYTVPVPYTTMGFAPYPVETLYPTEQARAMLAAAADRAHQVYPALTVDTALIAGSPAGTLLEESGTAGLVVVGSRGRGGFAGCRQ
jgi:nucleotide-binding universal stress UspA family protein